MVLTACGTSQVTAQSTVVGNALFTLQKLSALPLWKYRCRDYRSTIVIRTVLLPLPISNEFNPQNAGNSTLLQGIAPSILGRILIVGTKLSEEMRALYKGKRCQTSSAFLPLLIQMPVLMALFQALSRVEFPKSVTSSGWTL